MNRGGFPVLAVPANVKRFYMAFTGAGAAAPTVASTNILQAQANAASRVAAEVPTRSGAGQYVVFAGPDFQVPAVGYVAGQVYGATSGLYCKIVTFSMSARSYTVQIRNEAGVFTDLANGTDFLILVVDAIDSVSAL